MQKAQRFTQGNLNGIEDDILLGKASDYENDFFSAMKNTDTETRLAYTDNGALAYETSGSSLTDFDFNTSSYRHADAENIVKDFEKIFYSDKDLAMRYIFYVGDIREGKGERHIFNEVMANLASTNPDLAKAVIGLIPEYGRWDEVVNLIDTPIKSDVINLIKTQLESDIAASSENKEISLLAKWLPSINATKKDTIRKANIISKELGMDKKTYRKTLSMLRDKLNIIEKALAEKNVEKLVEMQEVLSSKQNYKYKNALMRLMPEERKLYFEKVLRGEAKFNADVLEPYEVYFRYRNEIGSRWSYSPSALKSADISYETMWKMLPNKVVPENEVLVIRDGSGSMTSSIPGTNNGQILDVASALTVYFSEHSEGGFKNKFITFSSKPELVDLSGCKSLFDKIKLLDTYDDCTNTNLEKTFDLILETAKRNHMTQDQLPKNLLIVSDMQFDMATNHRSYWDRHGNDDGWNETLFDSIRKKYEAAGYEIPRLIFWNVAAQKTTIPEIKNDLGLVLLSGYSKNIMDMICENNFEMEIVNEEGKVEKVQLSPEEVLKNKVYSERYDEVSKAIKPVLDKEKTNFDRDER